MEFAFLYAVCREGAEPLLKAAVAERYRGLLVPAFMRPQLLTWKGYEPLAADFEPDLVFARNWGFSHGLVPDRGAVAQRWKEVMGAEGPSRWDVYPRIVPEDGVPVEFWSDADQLRSELPMTPESSWIGEVILGEPGEPLLVGSRRLGGRGPVCPGGVARANLPADAPSRAWLKAEQALGWAGWDEAGRWVGKSALELGSAPGGISLALVRRGLHVDAVDPAPMNPAVLAEEGPGGAKVRHIKQPVGELTGLNRTDLLVSDMNLAPPAVLRYLERIQPRVRAKHWIITLKLNDAAMVSRLSDFRERLARIAPTPLRVVQLPANRREVTVIAG